MPDDKYEALRLKNQLCYPIYLCAKEIVRRYTPLLDKLDLTYTQYIVMMYFWEKGASNAKELSETLLLDPSTLTPLLRKLESKGYITRTRSESDARNLVLTLTKEGDALKDRALDVPKAMGACIDLDADEAVLLYKTIYKILTNVEKEINHGCDGNYEGNL